MSGIPPWLKDKRVQLAMAGAGVIGLVVFLKNRGSASSSTSSGSSGQPIQPANYDSSGVDAYNAIQAVGQSWDSDLQQFTQQLTDIQTALGKINGPPATTTPPPKTTPPPAKKPTPAKPGGIVKKPTPIYTNVTAFTTASAARGSNWQSTLSTIAQHYNTSVSQLLKLNPSIKNPNVIYKNEKIRVK